MSRTVFDKFIVRLVDFTWTLLMNRTVPNCLTAVLDVGECVSALLCH